jgi:hypothetical protein
MKTLTKTIVQKGFYSDVRSDIFSIDLDMEKVIQWADEHPVVWDIVTKTKSKAFGRGSCVYIGWAQKCMSSQAILERARHLKELIDGDNMYHTNDSIFTWRARFTFEHYLDKGFTGGFFQQHDSQCPRYCLTLDYTLKTLELVLDKFCSWIGNTHDTKRITIDDKTVRVFESDSHAVISAKQAKKQSHPVK